MRTHTLIIALPILIVGHAGLASAQGSAPLAGVWQRVSQKDSAGAAIQPPGPAAFAIYSANGYFSQSAIPTVRPKIDKPLAEMTKDELVSIFRDVVVWRGTYSTSGNKLTRKAVSHSNPNSEGRDVVQVFHITGDTLLLTS